MTTFKTLAVEARACMEGTLSPEQVANKRLALVGDAVRGAVAGAKTPEGAWKQAIGLYAAVLSQVKEVLKAFKASDAVAALDAFAKEIPAPSTPMPTGRDVDVDMVKYAMSNTAKTAKSYTSGSTTTSIDDAMYAAEALAQQATVAMDSLGLPAAQAAGMKLQAAIIAFREEPPT